MNDFYYQMFNPNIMNQAYYQQNLYHIQQYEQSQNQEILKAVHAMQDLCQAINKLDMPHQQQAFWACFGQMAVEMGWNRNIT